ncbi:MAG: ATP-binding protein [bacterium]|mgnify:FL=1|nr:ATP-binding protein [bacterium]
MQPLSRNEARRLWRAIIEFDMLDKGDRVLIGLSGGKDSLYLTHLLSAARRYAPMPFEIAAVTLDVGFAAVDYSPLHRFCSVREIPFELLYLNMAGHILGKGNHQGPCAVCAYFRRGALCRYAAEKGFNKLALAHHHDDAVETFLMSILYSGQIKVFEPVSLMERTGITVIRPLAYFRESTIKASNIFKEIIPLQAGCPVCKETQRARVKELIKDLGRENRSIYDNLSGAMRYGKAIALWPAEPGKGEMLERHRNFYNKYKHDRGLRER